MTEAQSQLEYRYNPPSALSTRQILESTSPAATATSTSTHDPSVPFRPQTLTRQKSTNYAEAEADARLRAAAQTSSYVPQGDAASNRGGDATGTAETGGTRGTAGWRPKAGRKQSWNQQDLKRAMQMSVMTESQEAEKAPGFSEVGNGKV